MMQGEAHEGLIALIVEDNPGDVVLVREMLRDIGAPVELRACETLDEADSGLEQGSVDVILLDLSLPDSEGLDSLARVHARAPDVPVIVITGQTGRDMPVLAVQGLAQEYLVKGEFSADGLLRTIRQAIERKRQQLELTRLADSLRANAEQFRQLVLTSTDGLLVLAPDGRVLFDNPAARALLAGAAPDLLVQALREPLSDGAELELWLPGDRLAELRVTATEWQGEHAFLGSVRDVTARKAAEVELRQTNRRLAETNTRLSRLADADPLTELRNRRGLERGLEAELERARRWGTHLSACLVSCEDFVRLVDAGGQASGDALLRTVGARLRAVLRHCDVLARTGGEEFVALLPETRSAEAERIAQRLERAGNEAAAQAGDETARVRAVAGAVPVERLTVEEVLAVCERSLQQELRAARTAASGRTGRRDAWAQLQAPGGLRAVAQPIRTLADGRAVALELSARGPEGEHESPRALFALARDPAERVQLDLWALEACLRAAERQPLDPALRLHVHLMPETVLESSLRRLLDLLRPRERPGGLCLELSEQRIVGDPGRLRPRIQALAEAGVELALDEGGAGRSTLEALLVLQPRHLVVEPRLVRDAAADPARRRALRRLVHAAAAIGCRTIASGVERREDLDAAREEGLELARGLVFEPPVPPGALAPELLRRP